MLPVSGGQVRALLERTIRQRPVAKTLREVESLPLLCDPESLALGSRHRKQHNDEGQVVVQGEAPAEEGGGGDSLPEREEPRGSNAVRTLPEENRGQDHADRDEQHHGRGLDDAVRRIFLLDDARGEEEGGAGEEGRK